jgi:hypothetical protein
LVEQGIGGGTVGDLAAGQQERDRTAEAIGQRVDLRRPPAAGTADRLREFPPLAPEAQRWALTADESISTSAGGPPADAKAWKMLTQTPLAAQRTKRL